MNYKKTDLPRNVWVENLQEPCLVLGLLARDRILLNEFLITREIGTGLVEQRLIA